MRTLQMTDVFAAVRVINVAGIREEVKAIAELVKEKEKEQLEKNGAEISIRDVGVDFLLGCLEKITGREVELAIYKVLAGPLEKKPEEIEKMDPLELFAQLQKLQNYVDKDKLKVFFNAVSNLIEKMK